MRDRGRHGTAAIWLVPLLFAVGRSTAGDDAPQIYARDLDREAIVREIGARSAEYATVLCVFDTATFNPPPGANEFKVDHRYRDDLASWFASVPSLAAAVKRPLFVAATSSTRIVPVLGDAWRADMERDLGTTWWQSPSFSFEPAAKWAARLVDQVGGRCMLVLVTGDILPEQTVKGPFNALSQLDDFEGVPEALRKAAGAATDESWRAKLLPVGEYWEEEKMAKALLERSSGLFVVAPEARFCDFLPVVEIPDVPWASRPVTDPPFVPDETERQANLEDQLKRLIPDEEIRKQVLKRMQETEKNAPPHEPGGRFESNTPFFCNRYGRGVFFNTDCPSGFGYWPFARAAAASGGRYLFYPFPPGKWLDACPRDPLLMSRLAPELGPRSDYLDAKRDDAALDAICDACRLVIEETPWTDSAGLDLHERAPGWMLFRSTKPFLLHKHFPQRDRPTDDIEVGWTDDPSPARLRKYGEETAHVAARYGRAIGILERSIEGGGGDAHPRSVANLVLARFWFEMSAFHLEALSIFLKEKARVREAGKEQGRLFVTYVPTIRMSDCLNGYSDRTVSPVEEAEFRSEFAPPGYQGNVLAMPQSHPAYRARRKIEGVLENLDPRLKERALRMIRAAEGVVKPYARSPWGWVVYYSEAYTFVSREGEGVPSLDDRVGIDILRPTTPRPPGSKDAGPRSGGG